MAFDSYPVTLPILAYAFLSDPKDIPWANLNAQAPYFSEMPWLYCHSFAGTHRKSTASCSTGFAWTICRTGQDMESCHCVGGLQHCVKLMLFLRIKLQHSAWETSQREWNMLLNVVAKNNKYFEEMRARIQNPKLPATASMNRKCLLMFKVPQPNKCISENYQQGGGLQLPTGRGFTSTAFLRHKHGTFHAKSGLFWVALFKPAISLCNVHQVV